MNFGKNIKQIGIGFLGQVFFDNEYSVDLSNFSYYTDDRKNSTNKIISNFSNNTNESKKLSNDINNDNENNSLIHFEVLNKMSMPNKEYFDNSTINNKDNFMYYFEKGSEDEGILYLYNDKSENIYKLRISNFNKNSFKSEHKFLILKWKYNSDKTECISMSYDIILKQFDIKPIFENILTGEGPCAG
jgi:hypothetical protein